MKAFGLSFTFPFIFSKFYQKTVFSKEEDLDHLQSMSHFDENDEAKGLSDVLDNPDMMENMDPEKYQELIEEQMLNSFSPPPFAYLHNQFKTSLDNESWKGLKLSLNHRPAQEFSSDYNLTIDKLRGAFKNYAVNVTSVIPGIY